MSYGTRIACRFGAVPHAVPGTAPRRRAMTEDELADAMRALALRERRVASPPPPTKPRRVAALRTLAERLARVLAEAGPQTRKGIRDLCGMNHAAAEAAEAELTRLGLVERVLSPAPFAPRRVVIRLVADGPLPPGWWRGKEDAA